MKKILFSITVILFLALLPTGVSADGGGPERPATEAEKTFHSSVLKTFKSAMPASLEGWEPEEDFEITPLERVTEGFEKYPWGISFNANWRKKISPEEENKKIEAGAKIMKAGEEKMKEIAKKQEAVSEKLGKAAEAGNMAEMEKLKPEIDRIVKEAEAHAAEQQKLLLASPFAGLSRDAKAGIHIAANPPSFSIDPSALEIPAIAGAAAMFRSETEDNLDGREGKTTILIGKWKKKKDGEAVLMEAGLDPAAPHTKVQTIMIDITAAAGTAKKIAESMDIKSLEKLLK